MSDQRAGSRNEFVTLIVRKTIRATPERLFRAWTEPAQLLEWWGPQGVECLAPEVDLRVGGSYRIGNRLPDGAKLWITGQFEVVEPPHRLVYTWCVEGKSGTAERVTVQFVAQSSATEVIVTHERIPDDATREQHALGWRGCLDGLAEFVCFEGQ